MYQKIALSDIRKKGQDEHQGSLKPTLLHPALY